ncbi:hypothetical protein TNIN_436271 [Trichonephila inaurata madagascariensis]|uniref:Uncharacterized protein n=1 Tax=Trichonephila inaurata madagascariensis TaxID=2747483 RepID=A0A8X7CB01_9ARAC|nr:hypothetical protein TNIN_436271 [Trichonephila inaurata madagascariensis]
MIHLCAFIDLFNEKYYFFPISIDNTQDVAVSDSEIGETFEVSTLNNYLENPAEKNSVHDIVINDNDLTAFSSEESTANPLPGNFEENAVDSNKEKKKKGESSEMSRNFLKE